MIVTGGQQFGSDPELRALTDADIGAAGAEFLLSQPPSLLDSFQRASFGDFGNRMAALDAVWAQPPEEVLPVVIPVLRTLDREDDTDRAFCEAVINIGRQRQFSGRAWDDELIRRAKTSMDLTNIDPADEQAVWALGDLVRNNCPVQSTLIEIAMQAQNARLRMAAIDGLGKADDAGVVAPLLRIVTAPEDGSGVRLSAVQALAALGKKASFASLVLERFSVDPVVGEDVIVLQHALSDRLRNGRERFHIREELLCESIRLKPEDPLPRLGLAKWRAGMGRYVEALGILGALQAELQPGSRALIEVRELFHTIRKTFPIDYDREVQTLVQKGVVGACAKWSTLRSGVIYEVGVECSHIDRDLPIILSCSPAQRLTVLHSDDQMDFVLNRDRAERLFASSQLFRVPVLDLSQFSVGPEAIDVMASSGWVSATQHPHTLIVSASDVARIFEPCNDLFNRFPHFALKHPKATSAS